METPLNTPAPSLEDIRGKIALLSISEDGTDLRSQMTELKAALKANPAASAMLLPEEIGELVKAIMEITKKAIVAEAEKKEKKEKKPKQLSIKLTEEEVEALKDVSVDDL